MQEDFGRALAELWARDGIVADGRDALAQSVAASFASGNEGIKAATEMLGHSSVRAQWNAILRRERAAALAERIRPLVSGVLVDVLSGDGSVCRALSDLGVGPLSATERIGDYPESVLPGHVSFRPFDDNLDLAEFGASTALVSTVLHHERDPRRLLDALTSIPRWIVVENCVTPRFSREFHRWTDVFFNACLNEFGVGCVEQHRTLDEWTQLLASYGTVSIIDEAFTVPGIPFPYSLLVVTRQLS